jgi:phage gp46-like protein
VAGAALNTTSREAGTGAGNSKARRYRTDGLCWVLRALASRTVKVCAVSIETKWIRACSYVIGCPSNSRYREILP